MDTLQADFQVVALSAPPTPPRYYLLFLEPGYDRVKHRAIYVTYMLSQ